MKSKAKIQSEIKRKLIKVTDNYVLHDIQEVCITFGHCNVRSLWEIVDCVSHRVFYVETETSEFIIKQLSPKMLSIPNELDFHINSQYIAQIVYAAGIPTIIAKKNQDGNSVNKFGNNYYMVFDYYPHAIKGHDVLTQDDCFKVGCLLGRIHTVNISLPTNVTRNSIRILIYTRAKSLLKRYLCEEVPSLSRILRYILFIFIQERVLLANRRVQPDVISHCDLTHNNILWGNNPFPYIIDWDAAGYINREKDIVQTIFEWCFNRSTFNRNFLNSFLKGYSNAIPNRRKLSKQACLAALSEDIECVSNDLEPEDLDCLITSIIVKWHKIQSIRRASCVGLKIQ